MHRIIGIFMLKRHFIRQERRMVTNTRQLHLMNETEFTRLFPEGTKNAVLI